MINKNKGIPTLLALKRKVGTASLSEKATNDLCSLLVTHGSSIVTLFIQLFYARENIHNLTS